MGADAGAVDTAAGDGVATRAPRASAALIVLAAVCFGTTGTAQALGGQGATAVSLGAARIVAGGALLAALAVVVALRGRARRRAAESALAGGGGRAVGGSSGIRMHRLSSLGLVLIGALGVAAYQPAFFTGTALNGVAVGTLIALGSAPVMTGLLEWGLRRRPPGWRWALATTIAAVGVGVLSGAFGGSADSAGASVTLTPLGLAASLGAGLSYAVYALSSKALIGRGYSGSLVMGATFGGAAVILLPVLLGTDLGWLGTANGLATALWLAVVTTALAYTLFARGLRAVAASKAATLTLVEPLTATLLGIAVLHEALTGSTVVGLALLVAGLAVLTVRGRGGAPVRLAAALSRRGAAVGRRAAAESRRQRS